MGEDYRIAANTDASVLMLARDGRQALMKPNGHGGYSAPGFKMTLSYSTGAWGTAAWIRDI